MRRSGVIAVALVVLLAAGLLQASNMGFKLNRTLESPKASATCVGCVGTANTGRNMLALPFYPQTNLTNVSQLATDIAAPSAASVILAEIQRYNTVTDAYVAFNPLVPAVNNFALTPGEGYLVRLKGSATLPNRSYIVVGSHNPGQNITFRGVNEAPGLTKTGRNLVSIPYHTTNANANALAAELGGTTKVAEISRFNSNLDNFTSFNPVVPAVNNFALTPGTAYLVRMKQSHTFNPSHY